MLKKKKNLNFCKFYFLLVANVSYYNDTYSSWNICKSLISILFVYLIFYD